ncbi:GFA family protein [Acidiphilium sp.]|uniref:GFA family protein n=1 Tax=Acidiphilium sp. TaxID=527 RepID=UPI003D07E2D0
MALGGCHCGGIRYEADSTAVEDTGICHCSICRRTSGAPLLAWAFLPDSGFTLLRGRPSFYRSSPECERQFCATCGCQLFYRPINGPGIGIHTATLDEPETQEFRPRLHMCKRID